MQRKKKETFTVTITDPKTQQTKDVELAVMAPNVKNYAKARFEQNKAFNDAINSNAPLRARLDNYARQQGVWSDEMQARAMSLGQRMVDNENKLSGGGCKLSDAYKAAIDLRKCRFELVHLMSERDDLDARTCEGQADNARFDTLVALSVVYNDSGELYFKGLEDYRDQMDSEVAVMAARIFASNFYGVNDDYQRNLPENQFLLKYGFCNDELHLIDKQGRLVDIHGRLVNEDGRLVDHDGNLVDEDGNPVNEDGTPIIEQLPFLDDDGNPLDENGKPIQQEPVPAKKTTRKKTSTTKKKTE